TDISQITNSIYISTLQTLQNNSILRENGITHILLAVPIDDQQYTTTEEFQFMNVSLYDTESEDLLSQLPACMEFIENGVIQGKVVVCCVAGMSRSAGIVIAYLMKHLHLNVDAAFNMVSEKRPCIMPNRGFMLQLQWWGDMNFTIDSNHNQYKLFILKRAHKPMDFSRPNDLSDIVDAFKASLSGDTVLKCKACRKVILTHAELITHEPEDQGQSSFPYSKRDDVQSSFCVNLQLR
ncbi:protein-tyrosine phosphatase-like protein, partial [Paraphysoderma sedebokerense]